MMVSDPEEVVAVRSHRGWTVRGWTALAGVLAAGAVLAALAGCDGDGGDEWDESVAARVGDMEITEESVETVAVDLRRQLGVEVQREVDELAAEGEMTPEELADHERQRFQDVDQQVATSRERVIEMRVLTETAYRHLGIDPVELTEDDLDLIAEDVELPVTSMYVRVVGEFFAAMSRLEQQAGPATPTEADQREVHENMVAEGLTTTSFEEAREVLTPDLLSGPVGLRNLLVEAIDQADVEVSPRYDLVYEVPVPLGVAETFLGVPLD